MIVPDTNTIFRDRFLALSADDRALARSGFNLLRARAQLLDALVPKPHPAITHTTTLLAATFLHDWMAAEAVSVTKVGGSLAFTLIDHLDGSATVAITETP